jgi:hypothetical protein
MEDPEEVSDGTGNPLPEATSFPGATSGETGSARAGSPPEAPAGLVNVDFDDDGQPLRFQRWMQESATGVVLSGLARGLQHALDHPDNRPAIVIEASGLPEDPDALISLQMDHDDPSNTVAVIRVPPSSTPDPAPPGVAQPPAASGPDGGGP